MTCFNKQNVRKCEIVALVKVCTAKQLCLGREIIYTDTFACYMLYTVHHYLNGSEFIKIIYLNLPIYLEYLLKNLLIKAKLSTRPLLLNEK